MPELNGSHLYNYIKTIEQYKEDLLNKKLSAYAYSFTSTSANNKAQAQASITFRLNGSQDLENSIPMQGFKSLNIQTRKRDFSKVKFGKRTQMAVATAAVSQNGYHQISAIYPRNLKIPNVNAYEKLPKRKNVKMFTFSQMKRKPTFQQAFSRINQNGRSITYTVHD